MTAPIPERHPDRSTRTEEAMSETERGKPISDERTLRDQLVAAGTAAAEEWLATRANRRMSDVNRKRLAGHVVNALWQQIEQATVEIAQWIAEDDRAELARVKTELDARIAAESADAAAGSYAGRAEAAEAEVERLRAKINDDAYTAMLRQRKAVLEVMEERDQARAERKAATARAEQAEAALAEMRERLGETREEWGISWAEMVGRDPLVYSGESSARAAASNLRETEGNGYLPTTGVRVSCRWVGEWREADATPRTALERAADEQGERPVRCSTECGEGHTYEPGSCEAAIDPDEAIRQNHADAARDWGIDEQGAREGVGDE